MQKFLKELFESFIRKEGREPDNLEMIILKQKAAAKDAESRKIISMFNKEPVDANKPIIGGTNIKETDDEILQRLTQENKDSINRIKLETRKGAVDAGLVDEVDPGFKRESMKLVDGKFETTKAPRKFRLNVDTFVRDFPVDKKEAERIATLSSDEQKKIIDKYLTNDTKQRIELMNFEPPKDREPNFKGGRIGFAGGSSLKLFLKNFFKTKPKKLETVNDFVDKRQFLKDLVGNTEKNKKARELKMLKEAAEEARNNPGFKFKEVDIDKDIRPIFDQSKDRTLNSTGGRIGYYGGGITNIIEPDLSDIGHGGEAMNSRTRIMTPGSQATTSTGLNYLLGEDNDTTRVPYNQGKMVLPQPKPPADPMVELNRVYNLYTKAGPGVSQETKKYLQQDFIQKLKEAEISQEAFMTNRMQNNFADGGRIGYKDGLNFKKFLDKKLDKATDKMLEKETQEDKNIYELANETLGEKLKSIKDTGIKTLEVEQGKKENEMFKMVEEFQTLKKKGIIRPDLSFRNFKKMKEQRLVKNKILELDIKYPEKKIIDEETGALNKKNLKSAIDQAEIDLEISPIDGLTLKRSLNTEGEQSVTGGEYTIGNFNFSSPNLEDGILTTNAAFNLGDLNLTGSTNTNDSKLLNSKLGFNYNNDELKGSVFNTDGYRSTELELDKSFPINDNFDFGIKSNFNTSTFDGKTNRSSDLTPKLSYNDGILSGDISKEILEGGDGLNLGAGVNYNNFYAKGDNLLSEDRSGVFGVQKKVGNKDSDFFFTGGAEINPFSKEKTFGAGLTYKFAEGGPARQGFKMGRRAFLGLMGSVGTGIAGLKAGIFGGGKKAVVKEVAKEAATGGPPVHFLKLVAKIKSLGDDAPRLAVKDKENVTTYKEYELTEDVVTGEQTIQRMKVTDPESASYYGQPLTEETYMSYKPGKSLTDETTKGKTIPDQYEEGTAHLRSDGMNAGEIVEESAGVSDEIFEEVGEAIPEVIRKEKADGGRIGYAGGKKVVDETLKFVKDKLGKKTITTADKVEVPKETLLRDMFTDTNKRLNLKKQMNDNEYEDFLNDIGGDNLEAYDFDGTVGDGARILKEQKKYEADMFLEYKKGNLDPVAGDKSPARKRFLEKKLEEAQMSGDNSLITYDEIEELSAFDLGTKMDNAKLSTNDEIKKGVASIMSDTSPAALEKSIEIDNLMLKYPGMNKQLAEQIATEINPRKKADIIAMVEQTFKMSEKGMSGDDIIQTFKNTPRTKQATGGLASILG